jgi:hypothetical protein
MGVNRFKKPNSQTAGREGRKGFAKDAKEQRKKRFLNLLRRLRNLCGISAVGCVLLSCHWNNLMKFCLFKPDSIAHTIQSCADRPVGALRSAALNPRAIEERLAT